MNRERYLSLSKYESLELTEEEVKDGWHFCWEWDGLLIHPTWEEAKCCCSCFLEE